MTLATSHGHKGHSSEILGPYDDANVSPIGGTEALSAFSNAGIDIQIATAHRFPRSIALFMAEAEDLVTANLAVAASCTYALPRGGKTIKGPSVRLAELLAYAWGNLRSASMVTGDDGRFIKAQSICLDLQKNVGFSVEARRRITDKHGKRFDDDMVAVTSNAAVSIAKRNGVFSIVPRTFVDSIHALAMQVAGGSLATLDDARNSWVDSFVKKGVPEARIYAALGVHGVQDITQEHLTTLQGFQTSIREGQATLDDIFAPPKAVEPAPEGKAQSLASKVRGKPAPAPEAPTPSPPQTQPQPEAREPGQEG